jgi:hypothetical protein
MGHTHPTLTAIGPHEPADQKMDAPTMSQPGDGRGTIRQAMIAQTA